MSECNYKSGAKIALFIKTYASILAIAAEKLVQTNKPITQIAYEAGYDTQQSFSFAFKQVCLYPPKTYRDIGIFLPKQNRISMSYSYMPKYYKFIAEIKEIAA